MGQRKNPQSPCGMEPQTFVFHALPLSCAHENCTCASDDPAPEHIKLICAVTYILALLF